MIDSDKVIKGLECCLSGPMKCDNCPYKEDDGITVPTCVKKLRNQAIELLKEQKPQWISVKDRLPEDEDEVLVYGISPRGRKKIAIEYYLAFEDDRPRWALDGIWTVLYWMPLPEPPET